MKSKEEILREFSLFSMSTGGIGSWLSVQTHDDVFERLGRIDEEPISAVQLNQLLVMGHEAPVEDGFFRYYWLEAPDKHPYNVRDISGFSNEFLKSNEMISSLAHLKWGLYRLYVDALLYFGNVRAAFRRLRDLSFADLISFFSSEGYDTAAIKRRGPPLPLRLIAKDSRYLISEMACKSFGVQPGENGDLCNVLVDAYKAHTAAGNPSPTFRELLSNRVPTAFQARQQEFVFSADEVLDENIASLSELSEKFNAIAARFSLARNAALENTRFYLSMLGDLDVYVATSMRNREDFRKMADMCERIFTDERLRDMNLRYFDPTLSAAGGHEDKGLIECLMVKCAKVLVYSAGDKESYGKDAEAAMALSLGKPVIFYCDQEQRGRFFRDIHPLSRLIEFETGIAVGVMVTDKIDDVTTLIQRVFENKMVYYLEKSASGTLRLKEKLTDSVVRLQTSDQLLSETFWNHYHKERDTRRRGIGNT